MQSNEVISSERDVTALLESARLKVTDVCESPPEVIFVGDSVIGTLGNFSGCTGKAKSKKTFNVCAIVAAAISGVEVLRYRVVLPNEKRKIIYIDTEQSPYHCIKVMQRVLRLAGQSTETHPDNLDFLALRKYAPIDRIAIIEKAIYDSVGVGLVIIDGIRDLALDINSPTEATTLITKLMQWTDERQIHIHTVLHQNKGDEHSRGHIGTELNNKAETILQVVKDCTDSDMSIVSPVHIRAMEFEKFAFRINGFGLPELVDDFEPQKTSIRGFKYNELSEEQHRLALEATFVGGCDYGYQDLIAALTKGYSSVGYSYGRNKMIELNTFLVNKRMILKEGKRYRFNSDFCY